jgi:hypothetical protein
MITQSELLLQLRYDPETGDFVRLVRHRRWKAGDKAGTLHSTGYVHIGINKKLYKAHRLAFLYMNGEWPKDEVDHINRDKSDNRWCNLREATRAQNMWNIGMYTTNTSGFKGVYWDKQYDTWRAEIHRNGKRVFSARFNTAEEAHAAYTSAACLVHREFARAS